MARLMRGRRPSLASYFWLLVSLVLLIGTMEAPLAELAAGENPLTHELSRLEDGGAAPIVDQASHPSQSPHYDASQVKFHHCDVFCNAQSRNHVQPGHGAVPAVRTRTFRGTEREAWHPVRTIGLDSRAPRAPPLI